MKTSGYSGTPLTKKLGIKEDCKVAVLYEPPDYKQLLEPIPPGVTFSTRATKASDVIHLFVVEKAILKTKLAMLRKTMKSDGMVWVSWPKKASKVPTDITEDTIREVCLPMGLVDIKVCAVSDIWSALKLVIRKELR